MAILTQYTIYIIDITESLQVPGTCNDFITKFFYFILINYPAIKREFNRNISIKIKLLRILQSFHYCTFYKIIVWLLKE